MRVENAVELGKQITVRATMKRLLLMTVALFAIGAGSAKAVVVFEDDFETGLANWQWSAGPYFTIDSMMNAVPSPGGTCSALSTSSASRIYLNLGFELNGPSRATVWIYDNGVTTRAIAQVYAYTGSGLGQGYLQQCLGIGKYNGVTMPGEIWSGQYYQGRVTVGAAVGWFNLNAPGAVKRSVGWHEFTIVREPDNTTIDFYVDNVFGRRITGANAATWDSIALGLGGGTSAGNAWYDGVQFTDSACPEDITVNNDAGICGAQVTYAAPGTQTAGLPSGSTFPVGATVNTFQFGDVATCSFTVTVVDTEPPTITPPADITVPATSPAGAQVNYSVTATDNCAADLVCNPPSGSVFPIGVTAVFCAAMDAAGNLTTNGFTVRVKGAAEQITDLIALVQSLALSPGTENSLLVKLQAAQAALSRGNINATCGNLKLFIHEVSAQAAKQQITEAQANLLIQEATRIEAVLDCRSVGL